MKRIFVKLQLVVFGKAYCASPNTETMDSLDELAGLSFPLPWKSFAKRAAARRERKTGQPWHITKFGREGQ